MRSKTQLFFRNFFLVVAVISSLLLTACGGGGGSSNSSLPPTTANVNVSIQGDLFTKIISPDIRASQTKQTVQSLKIRAIAYDNSKGNEVPGVQHINTIATYTPDGDYIAKVNGLSKDFDYRFAVLFGEGDNTRVLLQNHIDAASIKEKATFKINDISTKKVLAYEKWLENNPTDKKFNTFQAECSKEASKIGYTEDLYFDSLVNFSKSELKESLINITDESNPNAPLPTTASVDTEKLPATDNITDNSDNPVTPTDPTAKYANLTGKIFPAQNSNVTSFEVGVYSPAGLEQKKSVNANSTFTFEKLPVGTYTLVISSDETLNIIREIIIVGSETKEITDGRNNYIQASKVEATFTHVQDSEFARIDMYAFVQNGSDVYYQVIDGSDGVSILKQYDEQNKKPLEKDIFDAYEEKNISVYTTSKTAGKLMFFFKNSTGEKVFEKGYPLTYSYPNTSMTQNNNGYRLNLTETISLDLIRCEAGSFQMGSPENEFGKYGHEQETLHTVTLSKPFYLGKCEVTIAQFRAIMNHVEAYNIFDDSVFYSSVNLPVENLNINGAKAFCDKLNEIFADSIPSGYRFDLPSEAQWEYACRAGTTSTFNNGKNLIATTTALNDINWENYDNGGLSETDWYYCNSSEGPHEVGTKSPNQWGFYDMHGNVSEYCRDMYAEDSTDYPNTAVTDPVAASTDDFVRCPIRGGSWNSYPHYCRSAIRRCFQHRNYAGVVDSRNGSDVGFRLALVPIQ